MPNYSLKSIREAKILTCFQFSVHLCYLRSLEALYDIIENLKIFELARINNTTLPALFREEKEQNKLIAMDDILRYC